MTNSTPGRILFVGAGPGNPDLLTVRAREVLTSIADAWVDDGVGEPICRLVGQDVPVPREKVEEAEQEFARMVEEAKARGSRRRPTPPPPPTAANIRSPEGDPQTMADAMLAQAATGTDVIRLVAG